MYMVSLELVSMREATKHLLQIFDVKYEKAYWQDVGNKYCHYLGKSKQKACLLLLLKLEELFDGTLGNWDTEVSPYDRNAFSVPQLHEATLQSKVERLVKPDVLELQLVS